MSAVSDEIVLNFKSFISDEVAVPVAAMNSLIFVIRKSRANTWMELERDLRDAIRRLLQCRKEVMCAFLPTIHPLTCSTLRLL